MVIESKASPLEEQVLSREQMMQLVELGIDISDANMCWINVGAENDKPMWEVWKNSHFYSRLFKDGHVDIYIPTYTVSDLIDKLEKRIDNAKESRGLCIDYYNDEVGYFGSDKDYNEFGTIGADDCDASSTPLKDKLFNLLIWVRKNYGNR